MSKIFIKVIPKSSSNEIVGYRDDKLVIRLTATPTKGQANDALIKFLSRELNLAKSDINIFMGKTDRVKLLELPDEAIENLKNQYGQQ